MRKFANGQTYILVLVKLSTRLKVVLIIQVEFRYKAESRLIFYDWHMDGLQNIL